MFHTCSRRIHPSRYSPTEISLQVLCFSQWSNILKLLADAFTKQKIGHISLEGKGWDPKAVSIRKGCPVGEFVRNPSLTCFMLHAKSQSAGLNLVAATQYDSFYSCV